MANRMPVRSDRGFALVEALASMVIVALISLMILDGVAAGRRVWERMDSRATGLEGLEGAQSLLRQRIERLYPATLYDHNLPFVDFAGRPGGVAFLAPAPAAEGPGPLRRYRLSLSPEGDLILTTVSDAVHSQLPASEILLRHVAQVDMAYFGPTAADPQPRWRSSWDHEPQPPQRVRLRLAFAPGDARRWPELMVRPGATVNSDCSYDPSGGLCKAGS